MTNVNQYGWKALVGSAVGYAMDGFDLLILGFMLSAISADLNLTPAQSGSLVTWTLIGAVVGGIVFGALSDRYGRVRVLTWTIVLFAVFTGLCAIAQGYWDLLIYRTIAGIGLGGEFGIGAIMGAQIIGGIVAIVFAIFVKQIRKLFPDIVTGTVIFTIGLSLYPTAIRYMAGGSGHPEFGGLKNWFIALLTFAVVLFLNNFTKGVLKLGSLFFGIIVGYVVSLFMGMVDFTNVMNTTSIIEFPQLMHFKIEFAPAACASLAIVYAVNAVQTIGDLTSTTVGGMDRVPTDNELQGGILVQGVASIVGAFFGALPTASYSQNVGIVTMNKVVNRVIFAVSAAVLLIAGLIPGLSAALTTIPQCVIGGATLSVFAQIAMTGVRLFTKDGMTARKTTVVGMSVALGVGITQVSGCLQGPGIPAWTNTVFGSSSVVVATIMAIILNLTLPPEE